MSEKYTVYLLHFDKPVYGGQGKRPFQHYVGYTKDMEVRQEKHRRGNGSLWVRWMQKNGAMFEVVATAEFENQWEARKREREIKRYGVKYHCPVCMGAKAKKLNSVEAGEVVVCT